MAGREGFYVLLSRVQALLEDYGWWCVGAALAVAVAGPPTIRVANRLFARARHALTHDAAAAAARTAELNAARAARIEELQVRARLAEERADEERARRLAAEAARRAPGFGGDTGGGGRGEYRPLAGGGGPRPRIVSTMRNPPRGAGGGG